MAGNTFGQVFRITTFGESHGEALGVVIDGCPAGLSVSAAEMQSDLDRRKPGQSGITSPRKEADEFRVLSGIRNGRTLGTPIAIIVENKDQRPEDYEALTHAYRPSHADFTYQQKYGVRDHRGGGRSSARETVARVMAGSIAKQLLATEGISVKAYVSQVGSVKLDKPVTDLSGVDNNAVRCPDEATAAQMIGLIEATKAAGDTIGGTVTCLIEGCPVGLGEPVFDKLQADLAKAMMSINASKGFEYGSGFGAVPMHGSEHNDEFVKDGDKIRTVSNHSGGIQGGISNGMDVYFTVAFKPVATLMQNQETIDDQGNPVVLEGKGRHDPCVVPRAVPIVEAMAALVLADHWLRNRSVKI